MHFGDVSEKEETTGKKFSPRYTKEQLAFTERIRTREAELRKQNFKPANSKDVVNMKNLINPFQLKEFDPKLYSMLGQNGFAIVLPNIISFSTYMRRTTMLISQAS